MKDPLKIYNNPRLYAIAKEITLAAGFPYTDPRTLETTQPGETKMKNNKTPAWVLFDQIHVDVSIQPKMPEKERNKLRKALTSDSFNGAIRAAVIIFSQLPSQVKVKISR
jgi:hypothetical protein